MKALRKFARKRFTRLKELLVSFLEDQRPETLHEVRVEVKRLKAVLNFLQYAEPKFKAHKAFLPLRKIFREAGAIREQSVVVELLESCGLKESSIRELAPPTANTVHEFIERIPKHVAHLPETLDIISRKSKKVSKKKLRAYHHEQAKKIKRGLYPYLDKPQLHLIRKYMKELAYLEKLTGKEENKHTKFFQKAGELIGQWHDKQVVISMLQPERELYGDAISRLRKASTRDLRELRKLTNAMYSA
jgi:CHAD domain-containing protein